MLNRRDPMPQVRSDTAQAAHPQTPPLFLERLTQDEPNGDPRTDAGRQAIRLRLKRSVMANLQALLNCAYYGSRDDLAPWPQVYASTLNFGLPPLAGKIISDISWDEIKSAITHAIIYFEPRIIAADLTIGSADVDLALAPHNILSFYIQGRLRWWPAPVDFFFASRVDLENGHFELVERA